MLIMRLLLGISGCGKSYFATKFLANNKHWRNINRDDIRSTLSAGNEIWQQGQKIEQLVTDTQAFMCEQLIKQGFNVLVSDTNLSPRTQDFWKKKAAELGVKFEIDNQFLTTPIEVCILRDSQRTNSVGEAVIRSQYERYVEPLGLKMRPISDFLPVKYNLNNTLPKAIVTDADGTLCIFEKFDKTAPNYRSPFDSGKCVNDLVNEPVKKTLDLYRKDGYKVIVVSGREDKFEPQTREWLKKHSVEVDEVHMRKSGDYRKDYIIKDEIYKDLVKRFNIELVLDDRSQVVDFIRLMGLTVFQVADGNF